MDERDRKIAEQEAEIARIKAKLARMEGSSSIDSQGDLQVGPGGMAAGRDIHIGTYNGPPPEDEAQATAIYRRVLTERCGFVPLSGLEHKADDAEQEDRPLGLAQVYVDLDTRAATTDQAVRRALKSGQPLQHQAPEQSKKSRPLAALEAVAVQPRLVLLGQPGSGKTTFVNRLILGLAGGQWQGLDAWPADRRGRLPVLLQLRDFAAWLKSRDPAPKPSAQLFRDYLGHDLEQRNLDFMQGPLDRALDSGRAQLFLDGLDEVAPELAPLVLNTLKEAAERYGQTPMLVSCRVASYRQRSWQLPKKARFQSLELAAFDQPRIGRFIDAWYAEVGRRWRDALPRSSEELAGRLKEAVRRADLARLAGNPLLLTVMALVHTQDKVLPDHRALLYRRAVEVLLWRWDAARFKEDGGAPLSVQLSAVGSTETDLLRVLRGLAFIAHQREGGADDPEAVAGIEVAGLREALKGLHPEKSLDWAESLVQRMKERAGLLVEREPGLFVFPHRTFQEYLAGMHLALGTNFVSEARKLLDAGAFWREVILLAVGHRVHVDGEVDQPRDLVDKLCPKAKPRSQAGWRRVALAGEVLLEMGAHRATEEQVRRVVRHLEALVDGGRLEPVERAAAGDVLGRIGDTREGVGTEQGMPKMAWVQIPAGEFPMGMGEEGGGPVDIPHAYRIARYPVTVAQYGCFVSNGGYGEEAWWQTEAGREWWRKSGRQAPWQWEQQRLYPNRPVWGVSWFEAMAFCRWLSECCRERGEIATGEVLRLPTEADWEKAAAGPQGRRYPWGDEDWSSARANIDRSGIDHPSCVGMYPEGKTPEGVDDLAGNLWEWTLSRHDDYPYRTSDGRNDPAGGSSRVLRGGCWLYRSELARCSARLRYDPGYGLNDVGFRVVVSLADSGF